MTNSLTKAAVASLLVASVSFGASARADIISDTTINSRSKVVAAYASFDDFWLSLTDYLATGPAAYSALFSDFGSKSLVAVIGVYNSWATQVTFDVDALSVSAKGLTWTGPIVTGPSGNTEVNTGAIAVPAPVAAAGIPALAALVGFGLWMRRRESSAA